MVNYTIQSGGHYWVEWVTFDGAVVDLTVVQLFWKKDAQDRDVLQHFCVIDRPGCDRQTECRIVAGPISVPGYGI